MAFDSKYALNDAIRYLTKVAERRAAGGWVPPKERERQQKEAMRQEQQQARQVEKQQKEAARAEEKQQREAERFAKENGGGIGWSKDRINREIRTSHYNDGRSKNYVGYINPMDYLHATTPDDEWLKKIIDEAGDFKPEKIKAETHTPELIIENGKIDGHEGRHRMAGLAQAGHTLVPVAIVHRGSGQHRQPIDSATFGPQFDGRKPVTVSNMIPLHRDYANQINDMMAQHEDHFASGGQILSKQFPTQYMPNVGRQVMNTGGLTSQKSKNAIFLNDRAVIVGQEHGKPLDLDANTLRRVQDIANKHGLFYEGNGDDRHHTKGQLEGYHSSWDDHIAEKLGALPYQFLYTYFANVDANNRVQKLGENPRVSIFNHLLNTQEGNTYQGLPYDAGTLTKFLKSMSEPGYDFHAMSQQPATKENIQNFLKTGEERMWPENWEQYPNPAGQVAKQANDIRDQFLATRPAGVYVAGSGHLVGVQEMLGQQDQSQQPDIARASGGPILSKQFPTQYMPNVGRQVMNAGGTPDQPQRQLSPMGFYSAAAERASTLQPSGDAVQMVNALKNTQGIKTEELQNAGLIDESGNVHPDWAGRGKVTRDELVSHLQGQMPQVEETVLGGETPRIKELKNQMSQMAENDPRYFNLEQELLFEQTNSGTKYKDYTLPGGENYREVLLKLPKKGIGSNSEFLVTGKMPQTFDSREEAEEYIKKIQDMQNEMPHFNFYEFPVNIVEQPKQGFSDTDNFYSQHWRDDPNVLAHIRMSDRIGPNGEKILHVEELQSDWGQKGKKEGFAQSLDPKITDQLKSDLSLAQFKKEDARKAFNDVYENIFRENLKKYYANAPTEYDLPNALKEYDKNVKNAPPERKFQEYKGNFLRDRNSFTPEQQDMLQDAHDAYVDSHHLHNEAKNKHDEYISSSNGIPSAPYVTSTEGWTDLALKRVLKEAAEGGYDKIVWTPGAEQAKRYDLSKQISKLTYLAPDSKFGDKFGTNLRAYDHQGNVVINKTVPPKELENYVGKEVAQKLIDQEADRWGKKELSGLDLSVGGEGMKGYYDSIVPKRLQNLAKKHDKNARLGYVNLGGIVAPNTELDELSGAINFDRPKKEKPKLQFNLPSLDVTPTMRESILRGQSAYKRGGTVSKKHPALSIAGTHIREETHGEPIFTGRL